MGKFLALYDKAVCVLSKIASFIAGICITITAFIIFYEIIMRGVFHSPTEWVLEISTYLILVAGFLGMAVTLRLKGHIQVDFLTNHLSPRVRCGLEILTTFFAVLLFFVFMTESTDMVLMSLEFNKLSPTILRFPLYIPQSALILGSVLLELELIAQLLHAIQAFVSGDFAEERQG